MTQIRELSQKLSDQIAAGEVIERPSSVVKELVENAIDAQATEVDITFLEGGLKQIIVSDNGTGIAEDDLPLAFKRHATSKITTTDDLFNILTLGFRGEALSSIAAVSRVEILTNTGEPQGIKAEIIDGKLTSQEPIAAKKGTQVKVNDLFYNTPARLKYLKSQKTEIAKMIDVVNQLSLSYPDLSFRLFNGSKRVSQTAGDGDLKKNIANIYGRQIAQKMVPFASENVDFEISGFLSLPEMTRSNRNYMSILLNGRFIKNYQLSRSMINGYGSKLMVGRFPVVVLNIKMDANLVDVNVHPTKQEVRLSKEAQLKELIEQTFKATLAKNNLVQDGLDNLVKPAQTQPKYQQTGLSLSKHQPRQFNYPNGQKYYQVEEESQTFEVNKQTHPVNVSDTWYENVQTQITLSPFDDDKSNSTKTQSSEKSQTSQFPDLEFVGQVHLTYLIAQSDDGMYLVDQHAAQERLNYENYRETIAEVSTDQQTFLTPMTIELSNSDYLKVQNYLEQLQELGIELRPFGGNTFIINSHPTWMVDNQESLIREMIEAILDNPKLTLKQFREQTAIMMSCKNAIKANHYLKPEEAQALLDQLSQAKNPYNCPHGRPVLIHFSQSDMEKMFRRIQQSHQRDDGELGE
ncbi:DNA mismatch repair endonuclease MutL [Holzapfeliella sp. He02]|uniref:DNA mismatch repair protein MutL n=1 Tax=Holzapfeliella saturejae TaxID=3082953 RepID=A0ABU8SFL2_9LACO